jgi:hypothetical protein
MSIIHTSPESGVHARHPLRKIAAYSVIAIATIVVGAFVTLLFLPDSFFDVFLRDRVIAAFHTAYPIYTLQISRVHYKALDNRIECDSVTLTANDSTFSGSIGRMSLTGIGRMSLFHSERIAADILASAVIDVRTVALDFPRLQQKGHCARIRLSVPDSSILIDTLEVYSLPAVGQIERSGNSTCTIGTLAASKVDWVRIIRDQCLGPECLASLSLDATGIAMIAPDWRYELHCGRLRMSVPDSEIVAHDVDLGPPADDEAYFAGNKFRDIRVRAQIPECTIRGARCISLWQQTVYSAGSIDIVNPSVDVLVNKDKPLNEDDPYPSMPHEFLSTIRTPMQIGTLRVTNGSVQYGERFAVREEGAALAADSIGVVAEGIANQAVAGAMTSIHAQGRFMKACTVDVTIAMPCASQALSLRYSGSMSRMEMSVFNSWLEPAEHKRIKSGVLESAALDIRIVDGKASGNVRAIYSGLSVAAQYGAKRRESGIVQIFTSFIANTFVIRGTNQPDETGAMKIGVVKRVRKPEESFVQFLWFSLRGGLYDIIGAEL